MSEQTYIDVDALLEELRNLPPPTETYAFYTESEPGIAFLNDQLYTIFNGFFSQFFTPDITTFVSTCDSLIPLLDLALLTAKNRQLVCFISSHFDALAYKNYRF
jgi:hypothetical protein